MLSQYLVMWTFKVAGMLLKRYWGGLFLFFVIYRIGKVFWMSVYSEETASHVLGKVF